MHAGLAFPGRQYSLSKISFFPDRSQTSLCECTSQRQLLDSSCRFACSCMGEASHALQRTAQSNT